MRRRLPRGTCRDTGQFANHLFIGYPLFDTGNFGRSRGTMVPDVEDGFELADNPITIILEACLTREETCR
jgi:hypothetical protein